MTPRIILGCCLMLAGMMVVQIQADKRTGGLADRETSGQVILTAGWFSHLSSGRLHLTPLPPLLEEIAI